METVRVGGRKYSDPDVISLIRATGQLVDPRTAVINQARKLNEEYRSFDGGAVPPMQRLDIIASICGLTISPMSVKQWRFELRDAVLVLNGQSRGNRGRIFYNPQRPPGRVAFSIAHEIGHTFFPSTISGARFRDLCGSDSREADELERLCDLAASELLMPIEEFRSAIRGDFTLARVQELANTFGSSFEATAFRLATAHPGIAIAGLLRYRLRKSEERLTTKTSQEVLFAAMKPFEDELPEPKYRRQSFFSSPTCGNEHMVRWNKSFGPKSCVYDTLKSTGIVKAIEILPNQSGQEGLLEVVRAPFQREDAHPDFPDLLFFWSATASQHQLRSEVALSSVQPAFL